MGLRNRMSRRFFCRGISVLSALWLLNFLGVVDHLFERKFDQFAWPQADRVDVKRQVRLLLTNGKAEHSYLNSWEELYERGGRFCPKSVLCDKKAMDENEEEEEDEQEETDDSVTAEVFLSILVKSKVTNFAARRQIRELWGKKQRNWLVEQRNFLVRTAFLVAFQREDPNTNNRLLEEADQFGDLLVGDFIDDYRNNTLKTVLGLRALAEPCYRYKFVLFVDDDYHVSVVNAIAFLRSRLKSNESQLYAGFKFDTEPFRMRFHKHYISLGDYPYDRYPPYISAGAVVLSNVTARHFFLASHYLKYFPYDDVYLGMAAKTLDVKVTNSREQFPFWAPWTAQGGRILRRVVAAHGFDDLALMRKTYWDNCAALQYAYC